MEEPHTLWHATAKPLPPYPPLTGRHAVDLLIVGAGFLGLSTALHASEPGQSVMVLEQARIAWGASGRNAGFVVPNFAKVDPDAVRARLDAGAAERLLALAAGSADLTFRLIAEHGIACDARQSGWIQPSHSDAALAAAAERVRQWTALGRPVSLLDADGVQALTGVDPLLSGWLGGWIDRSGGTLNPVGYARGLAEAAVAKGATIHEDTVVLSLTPSAGGWTVRTPEGEVSARRVVLATNAYAGNLWPHLAQSFFPLKVFQIATRTLDPSVRQRLLPGGQCVSDSRRNLFTFRFDAENRLITGGMHSIGLGADRRIPAAIRQRMARMLDIRDMPPLEFSWSGMAAVSPDFLPRLISLGPNLIAGFACNGRGIAMTTALGQNLAEWALSGANDALAVPVTPLQPIPMHGILRHAPNALLPISKVKDRLDTGPLPAVRRSR